MTIAVQARDPEGRYLSVDAMAGAVASAAPGASSSRGKWLGVLGIAAAVVLMFAVWRSRDSSGVHESSGRTQRSADEASYLGISLESA